MITVRPATTDDLESISLLEKETFSLPWNSDMIKDNIEKDKRITLVAYNDEIFLGYILAHYVLDEGYIDNIAIKKDYQSKSIGSTIIAETIKKAKTLGLSFLTLEVRESNLKAINLYQKFNFTQVGLRKNFYTKPTENAILMTLYF